MALDRQVAVFALVFAIPPAVGVALAVLRVGGPAALWQAILSGASVGVLVGALVVVLAAHGSPEADMTQPE